jgi:hypothetical protein
MTTHGAICFTTSTPKSDKDLDQADRVLYCTEDGHADALLCYVLEHLESQIVDVLAGDKKRLTAILEQVEECSDGWLRLTRYRRVKGKCDDFVLVDLKAKTVHFEWCEEVMEEIVQYDPMGERFSKLGFTFVNSYPIPGLGFVFPGL